MGGRTYGVSNAGLCFEIIKTKNIECGRGLNITKFHWGGIIPRNEAENDTQIIAARYVNGLRL